MFSCAMAYVLIMPECSETEAASCPSMGVARNIFPRLRHRLSLVTCMAWTRRRNLVDKCSLILTVGPH